MRVGNNFTYRAPSTGLNPAPQVPETDLVLVCPHIEGCVLLHARFSLSNLHISSIDLSSPEVHLCANGEAFLAHLVGHKMTGCRTGSHVNERSYPLICAFSAQENAESEEEGEKGRGKKVTAKYMKSKLNYLKPYVPKM